MKRLAVAVLCASIAVPLFAQEGSVGPVRGRFAQPTVLPDLNVPFTDLLREVTTDATRGPLRTAPNVVLEGAEAGFVLPIVGSTAAGGGLFFRSETVIVNKLNRRQEVAIFYFPIGGGAANCTRPAKRLSMDADTWYVWSDFVSNFLQTSGLGAVIALPVSASGEFDRNGRIDGNSRIWTPQPGTSGTTSQNFPSVSLQMPAGGQSSFGLRHDQFYRSNYGIFNYATNARTFDIAANGTAGSGQQSITVDACSAVLAPVQGGPYGAYELFISARDGQAMYFSFGSSVDNATGDSWSVIGRSF